MLFDGPVNKVERLPPPPAMPQRAPAVAVAGEVETRIAGRFGGPSLAARVGVPTGAVRAVVICHPHPLYGGSMHSPVPLSIAKCLADEAGGRVAWARFDFRGVGGSEGIYDDGRGEVDDALCVLDELRRRVPEVPVTLCGHSFGSWVALQAAKAGGAVDRALLLAPSVRFRSGNAGPASVPTTIFIGDRDEFCDVDEARALAAELRAELTVFEGFDHHFLKSRRTMARAAVRVIAPEVVSP
jgi:alpha/beta superfamily hydrolase